MFLVGGLLIFFCVSASLRLIFPKITDAQVRPVYDQGALGLGQLLKRLNTTASVMMIGAHPDDEDTALLAYLARGESARTAYLSVTRGDGGQNIIGPELGESLGVIRTEELLQARRLDGAEQYFTRAYDHGFSKTLAEARQKWDEKIILCDVVRAIRMFRPLVVVSQFSGTSIDGHGHHQFTGYISPLAVKAAADVGKCKDAGPIWAVKKFYVRHGFRATGEPMLRINTGRYDPLLGRSYFEIAMEARSQHKSQEQGVLELKGDQYSGLNLVESSVSKVEKEAGIFDGLDTSLREFGSVVSESAKGALEKYNSGNPQEIIPILANGYTENLHAKVTHSAATPPEPAGERSRQYGLSLAAQKNYEFSEAITLAAGIRVDAIADKETIVPGEEFIATVRVFFPNTDRVKVKEILLLDCYGCSVSKIEVPADANVAGFRRETADEAAYFKVSVRQDAKLTQPYWLENKRRDSVFIWQNDDNQTLPFQPPLVSAAIRVDVGGKEIRISRPVEYRFADDVRGEVRRALNVVPGISVKLDQNLLIIPQSEKAQTRRIVMRVKNNSSVAVSGSTDLKLPKGWKVKQNFGIFQLNKKGESKSFEFDLIIPANFELGDFDISARVNGNDDIFTKTINEIAYPHIQTHRFYTEAKARVAVMNLQIASGEVGYISGTGDEIPAAMRQMGLNVTLLEENQLAAGDLFKFDVIVVGIRASEVRADFVSNNQRLLDWVKNGGTLIVQYQRPVYAQQNLTPFPAQMGPRVADENAKVTILQPNHPILNFPNKITEMDFVGWVQERNLYNFSTFDEKYISLLESHDPGEPENKGGLVIADVGRGKYIYCSYSLFRQLPAGVPGAYRLFANMLSLPKERK